MKEEYRQIGMEDAENFPYTEYMDGNIAFLDNLNELPHDYDNNIKVNILLIIACIKGKLSVSVNTNECTIHAGDFLFCMPNAVVNDCMISPDFQGKVLCLSPKAVLEIMHMDSDLWNKTFRIKENPVIHLSPESVELFQAYNTVLSLRNKAYRRAYRKEVISSLVRVFLYEILSELSGCTRSPGGDLIQQKDLLFKRFLELLSSCEIKPRNVAWYGEKLCITPKYLSTVCKQVSGKTAFQWINEYVMTDIRHQIKFSDKSIKEVADYLGFPNISFFGKYVKAHTGLNPTEYRKQLREKTE